jgi:hypothetical protein
MTTHREIIAKYADTTNRRPGYLREAVGRFIALPDLRKEVEFESSFDGGSLLIGEDSVHEQIRRDVGHDYAPWCDTWVSYIRPRSLAAKGLVRLGGPVRAGRLLRRARPRPLSVQRQSDALDRAHRPLRP